MVHAIDLVFFFDISIQNSYILYCESPNHDVPQTSSGYVKYSHLDYRKDLAKQLIGDYTCRKQIGRPRKKLRAESHVHYPKNRRESGRVRTNLGCETCDLHMCIDCFKPYHITNKLT